MRQPLRVVTPTCLALSGIDKSRADRHEEDAVLLIRSIVVSYECVECSFADRVRSCDGDIKLVDKV